MGMYTSLMMRDTTIVFVTDMTVARAPLIFGFSGDLIFGFSGDLVLSSEETVG